MTAIFLATTQEFGPPPPPPEPRQVAKVAGVMLIMVTSVLVLLLLGWIMLGAIRRRWIGLPGGDRRAPRRRRIKDPWFEAGRRADTDQARPRPSDGPGADLPPPGEEPYQ